MQPLKLVPKTCLLQMENNAKHAFYLSFTILTQDSAKAVL